MEIDILHRARLGHLGFFLFCARHKQHKLNRAPTEGLPLDLMQICFFG